MVDKAKLPTGEYTNINGNIGLSWGLVAAAKLSELELFYGSYPITPASDILHELSKHKNFDVITFQAEDEIAAAAATVGASFTGKLAVTGTSGPGLALKSETISLALTAAETGHLVFGTLHASNVSSTVTRILDVFPPSQKTLAQSMLAGSIKMVLSQQLLKKKGGGRIGCFEVMTGTTAIRNLIREGKTAQITSTLQTSAQDGMITMEKYLEGLQQKGLVE